MGNEMPNKKSPCETCVNLAHFTLTQSVDDHGRPILNPPSSSAVACMAIPGIPVPMVSECDQCFTAPKPLNLEELKS